MAIEKVQPAGEHNPMIAGNRTRQAASSPSSQRAGVVAEEHAREAEPGSRLGAAARATRGSAGGGAGRIQAEGFQPSDDFDEEREADEATRAAEKKAQESQQKEDEKTAEEGRQKDLQDKIDAKKRELEQAQKAGDPAKIGALSAEIEALQKELDGLVDQGVAAGPAPAPATGSGAAAPISTGGGGTPGGGGGAVAGGGGIPSGGGGVPGGGGGGTPAGGGAVAAPPASDTAPVGKVPDGNLEGTHGGQCVVFVQNQVGTHFPVYAAKEMLDPGKHPGYNVVSTPKPGEIFVQKGGQYGHTGIVKSVNSDGTLTVIDSNWNLDEVVHTHNIPASQMAGYLQKAE